MNRKLSAIAIMAILILSVLPFAFAEDRAGTNSGTGSSETEDSNDDSGVEGRSREDRIAERQGNREAVRDLRTEGRDARKDIREQRGEKKDRFNELRDQIKSTCKGNKDSTECTSLRDQARGEAKVFLTSVVDRMLTALNNAKAKIEANDAMDATAKQAALDGLNARIDAVTAVKAKIDALAEQPTRDEVQEIAKELRTGWTESKKSLRMHVGKAVNARMAGIVVKSEKLSEKLNKAIEKLKAKGIDTSGIEADVAAFNTLITDAKVLQGEATQLFASGDVDGAQAKLQDARAKLKEAHEKLKAIVASLKSASEGSEDQG